MHSLNARCPWSLACAVIIYVKSLLLLCIHEFEEVVAIYNLIIVLVSSLLMSLSLLKLILLQLKQKVFKNNERDIWTLMCSGRKNLNLYIIFTCISGTLTYTTSVDIYI